MVKAQRLKELLARYHREVRGVVSAEADAQLQRWQDDKGANEPLKALGEIVSQMDKPQEQPVRLLDPIIRSRWQRF